jgi:hypothetical protein
MSYKYAMMPSKQKFTIFILKYINIFKVFLFRILLYFLSLKKYLFKYQRIFTSTKKNLLHVLVISYLSLPSTKYKLSITLTTDNE